MKNHQLFKTLLLVLALVARSKAQDEEDDAVDRDLTIDHLRNIFERLFGQCIPEGKFCLMNLGLRECCDTLSCQERVCKLSPACSLNGPTPTEDNTILKFLAFGDTPYDEEVGFPFEGPEYDCIENTMVPGMLSDYADQADFVGHVGDIKKGSSAYADYCNDTLFESRHTLFDALEPALDFFLVPGDNEWGRECNGYDSDPFVDDVVKTSWRNYFAAGSFAGFDRTTATLPSGAASPTVVRQAGNAQNFFFTYSGVAFFGITEPAGEREYDAVNADWMSSQLASLSSRIAPPDAVVIFAHASPSEDVQAVLETYKQIPTLYVTGNEHVYCMKYYDSDRFPNLYEVTVSAHLAAPLLISIVSEEPGGISFNIEKTPYGCREDSESSPSPMSFYEAGYGDDYVLFYQDGSGDEDIDP